MKPALCLVILYWSPGLPRPTTRRLFPLGGGCGFFLASASPFCCGGPPFCDCCAPFCGDLKPRLGLASEGPLASTLFASPSSPVVLNSARVLHPSKKMIMSDIAPFDIMHYWRCFHLMEVKYLRHRRAGAARLVATLAGSWKQKASLIQPISNISPM